MSQKIETNDAPLVDSALELLEEKIHGDMLSQNFKKHESGNYFPVINGIEFNLPIKTGEQLAQAISLIQRKIMEYYTKGYDDELYIAVDETNTNKGIVDIRVNNNWGKFLDTGIIAHEEMKKVFGKDFSAQHKQVFAQQLYEAIQMQGYQQEMNRIVGTQ